MSETAISSKEFIERLEALCLSGAGPQLPRKRRDRHILLKSVALALRPGQVYTEAVINQALQGWLSVVGRGISMDHVSLRRHLIDEGYLRRNADGSQYEVVETLRGSPIFEPLVDEVDPAGVLRAAQKARAEKHARRQSELPDRLKGR